MSTSIYKVSNGSTITFKKRGPELYAVLSTLSGQVINGPSRIANTEESSAREILIANNIVDPNSGEPLPYTVEGSQDSSVENAKGNNFVYEISRKQMVEATDETALNTAKINNEIASENNKILDTTLESQLPPDVKFINIVNNQKNTIKKRLIPFIIGLLSSFGASIISAIQSGISLEDLKNLISCPSSTEINRLLQQRNKLVNQINGIYNTIKSLTTLSTIQGKIATAVTVGINAIALIPPGTTPGSSIVAYGTLSKLLDKTKTVVNTITLALASFGVFLGLIIKLLNNLDFLLQLCAQNNNMNFEQLNNEINALANPTIIATQSEDNTYKGFTLGVKIDETNESQYIRRYAVAQNKQGVDVLRTDSSFASDPAVLVSQLKFIIDSNPNITAE